MNEKDIELLRNSLPFWEHLSQTEQTTLLDNTTPHQYTKGTSIHNADYNCIGMLFVKSGSLRVYILSEDGREITLYRIGSDESCILSASCILKSITFDVYIDVVSDCEILQICSVTLSSIMEKNIYVEAYINRLTTERFSDVMWAMQQILFMSFDKRLAIFLLDESASLGSNEIPMTHEQIAKLMGSAREVVTRMLKYFSTEGYVALSRGSVEILDKEGLRKLL